MLLSICLLATISGCGKKELFVNEDDKYKVESVEQNDLKDETFYVKEGSYFYVPYEKKAFTKVPSAYSTSILAIKSVKSSIEPQTLNRYKYLGYSFGIYGGTFNSEGYITFPRKNIIKNSTAYDLFYTSKANEIRLVSINGEKVSQSILSDKGVIADLEENQVYQLSCWNIWNLTRLAHQQTQKMAICHLHFHKVCPVAITP